MKETLSTFLKGACMGAADVVPGVSGGTMALILGIYDKFINGIKSFDALWLKALIRFDLKSVFSRPHLPFLIPLVLGVFSAVLFFTRVVPLPVYIKTRPEIVYSIFFGLILGSTIVLFQDIKNKTLLSWFFALAGIALGAFVFSLVPTQTPHASWFIFLCGVISISAMLLPGISGSFILLMMKKYDYILNAIGHFQFSIIIPFWLGSLVGIVMFSRVLSWLLRVFHTQTLMTISGILCASLWVLWPFQDRVYVMAHGKEKLIQSSPILPQLDQQLLFCSLLIAISTIVVIALEKWVVKIRY